jgi:hypothetical protein
MPCDVPLFGRHLPRLLHLCDNCVRVPRSYYNIIYDYDYQASTGKYLCEVQYVIYASTSGDYETTYSAVECAPECGGHHNDLETQAVYYTY